MSISISSVFPWDVVNEALDNELILNMIFDNLNDSCHLTVCRLVCSKWNQLSVKHMIKNNWRNRKILKMDSDDKLQYFINTFASSSNPYLLFSCFSILGELNHVLLKNFFTTFPQQMKSLHLYHRLKDLKQLEDILESQAKSLVGLEIHSSVENFDTFSIEKKELKSEINFSISNLRYVCLTEHENDTPWRGDDLEEIEAQNQCYVHIQIMNLILSKITPDNTTTHSVPLKIFLGKCCELTAIVNLIEKFGFIKNLKMIELLSFKSGELDIFTNAGVQLEILALESDPNDHDENKNVAGQMFTSEIYHCLQNQTNSLEMLKYEGRVFKFPSVMRALKILSLTYRTEFFGENDQIPLFYHQYFPNLEILVLRSPSYEFQTSSQFLLQFLSPQEPCLSLRRLSIHYYYLQAEIMERISSTFPNIKSLAVGRYCHGTDDEESLIYSKIWNSTFAETLEELHLELGEKKIENVYPNKDTFVPLGCLKLNALFCGVKQDEFGSFYRSSLKNYEFDESKYNSILKLKNLKKLQIICFCPQEYPFTDFSVFYIFGNIKKLQFLYLDEKSRQFSPIGLKYLMKKRKNASTSYQLLISFSMCKDDSKHFYFKVRNHSTYEQNMINLLDDNQAKKKENFLDVYNLDLL